MSTEDVAGWKMSTTHVIDPTGLWYRVVPLGSSAHGMSNYLTRCVQKVYAQGLIVAWTLSYFMNTCNLTSEELPIHLEIAQKARNHGREAKMLVDIDSRNDLMVRWDDFGG
jgi:hypothetical protein